METDSSPNGSCYCSFEWLITYSNYVEYVQLSHNDDRNSTFSA